MSEDKRAQMWANKDIQKYINSYFDDEFKDSQIPKWIDFKLFKTVTIKEMFDILLTVLGDKEVMDTEDPEPHWHELLAFPFISDRVDPGTGGIWDYLHMNDPQFPIPKEVIDCYEVISDK